MTPIDEPPAAEVELLLSGGRANVGQVVRVGGEVARPHYPQTATVTLFLDHLHDAGISFVPRPLGHDSLGRQRLQFIEGTVPKPPFPPWAFDDALLIDVAHHQQQLHHAAASFSAPRGAVWATSAGDYFPEGADGSLVCHNDLGMSNTVIDPNQLTVTGFIDFDYCRPVTRLFDVAIAARHWVPFGDLDLPPDVAQLDRIRRFQLFCDVHRLNHDERQTVVELAIAFLKKARLNVRALAAQGRAGFQQLLDDGYDEVNEATVLWLVDKGLELSRVG